MPSAPNLLIVHGSYGKPEGNWFPWLRQMLEDEGAKVKVPQFPTPEGQSFASWSRIAKCALSGWDPADTILAGHSTGAIFILRLAELAEKPYRALFPVCPFVRDLGLTEYDPLNADFVHHKFDWGRIKRGAKQITCLAGANDPYVPFAYSEEVAAASGAEMIAVEKGGHLNAESGYREFPLLLEKIREACA